MVWNTIAHPKMMDEESNAGSVIGDTTETTTIEGIKYADPHKLAFFDLLVEVSNGSIPKLIHGDFETVKNKILNHEFVIGGEIGNDTSLDGNTSGVALIIASSVDYEKNSNSILLDIPIASGSRVYTISSDNAVSPHSGAPFNPGPISS